MMDARTAAEMNGWLHRQILDMRDLNEAFVRHYYPDIEDAVRGYVSRCVGPLNEALDVIADCDSKIAILEEHAGIYEDYLDGDGIERSSFQCKTCESPGIPDNWPCRTYLLVASAFRHKPGYKAGWAPEPAPQQG